MVALSPAWLGKCAVSRLRACCDSVLLPSSLSLKLLPVMPDTTTATTSASTQEATTSRRWSWHQAATLPGRPGRCGRGAVVADELEGFDMRGSRRLRHQW